MRDNKEISNCSFVLSLVTTESFFLLSTQVLKRLTVEPRKKKEPRLASSEETLP